MNYGFLIRNDRCIGCHACSTACKAENQVPLGVHRTWVKTVETGAFPDVRRHFQVTRCNHCADPPCVAICPTRAMYQRDDGIVEFDADRCIGCKACLQGCPYDAIHIDPESGTAAKCHFCAHRVELAMEPPCVVVCPEHAIIAGDMDDPGSEISRELARHKVTVRRPEKGTKPKLFYVDGDEAALHPGLDGTATAYAATERPAGGMQGDRREEGPIRVGRGRMADELVRTAYDVEHKVPWHWPVPAYLVTKGIAAGIFLLLAGGVLADAVPLHERTFLGLGFLILLFLGATTVLLVADLERPERFHWVLLKAHPRSWLVKGAWILTAFSALVGLWWVVELAAWQGWWREPGEGAAALASLRPGLLALGTPLAVLVAIYTAFLFGQAKGRDLWDSPLLPVHLLAQALLAGSAALLVLQPLELVPTELVVLSWWTFAVVLLVDLVLIIPAEFATPHGSDTARAAARAIVRGRYRKHFWVGAILLGHVIPLVLLGSMALSAPILLGPAEAYGAFEGAPWLAVAGGILASGLAGVLSLVGLYLYEHAWVMAPQELRNS
jgi:Fe-S-cluster-containing dehydrogenase component/formate-dependent nitrite reductase membrane component NrfD